MKLPDSAFVKIDACWFDRKWLAALRAYFEKRCKAKKK